MSKRILVTGAGTGASNNLIRSLKAEDPGFFVVGCNFDRFILKHAAADRLYLIPAISDPRFSEVLARLATTEQIDLVIPTTDSDVTALSDLSKTLGRRVFLPDPALIRLCQDKYNLTEALRARKIPRARDLCGHGCEYVGRSLPATWHRPTHLVSGAHRKPLARGRAHDTPGTGAGLDSLLGGDARRAGFFVHPLRVPAGARLPVPEPMEGWVTRPCQHI